MKPHHIFLSVVVVASALGVGVSFVMQPEPGGTNAQGIPATRSSNTPPAQKIFTIKTPGYTELVANDDGVTAALSRDTIIEVLDVKNPASPIVSETIDTPAFAEAVYEKKSLLYIADNREFQIRDTASKVIGVYALSDFWPSAITVDAGYAYLASGSELMLLDVRDPKTVKKLSRISLTGRAPSHVIVTGGYAYVVETLGGLNIVDIRNPAKPSVVKVLPFESHTVGFRIQGNYAYLGRVAETKSTAEGYTQTSRFEVIDITRPALASVVGSVEIPTNIKGLDLDGTYAFVIGSYPYRLTPIDIRSPASPKIISSAESITGAADFQDVIVENGYAWLADGSLGVRVVNVTNPAQPRHVKDLDLKGRAFNLYKTGNKLYVGVEKKYFSLADTKNPEAPQLTYTELFTASYNYTSIVLQNKKAYFNAGGGRIYDVANPKIPVRLDKTPIEADSIQLQNGYLYSTIGEIGLLAYSLANPTAPALVSKTPFPAGIPRNLSVHGKWAVGISNSPYSITAFDISNPKKPIARGSYQYTDYPNAVTVKDNYAYVSRGTQGVDVISIQSNGSLKFVKNIPISGYANAVTISGTTAFVVRDGADLYDIRNPANPIFLRHIENNKGEARHIAVSGDYVYIADGHAGVTIVKLNQ